MTPQKKAISRRKGREQPIRLILDAPRGEFYEAVAEVVRSARSKAHQAVNFTMVEAYWHVGRMIVEEEQQGKERAEYGKRLLIGLSERLTLEFGKGYDASNLRYMRQFYQAYPICDTVCHKSGDGRLPRFKPVDAAVSSPIRGALRPELYWSHYRLLIRVEKHAARDWYMNEAADQNWPVRVLERQINSLYYERLRMSRDKKPVIREMQEKTKPLVATPQDFIHHEKTISTFIPNMK